MTKIHSFVTWLTRFFRLLCKSNMATMSDIELVCKSVSRCQPRKIIGTVDKIFLSSIKATISTRIFGNIKYWRARKETTSFIYTKEKCKSIKKTFWLVLIKWKHRWPLYQSPCIVLFQTLVRLYLRISFRPGVGNPRLFSSPLSKMCENGKRMIFFLRED